MKTTLYLIRHGETVWNKLGKFQGCTDIELSEEGINQAELLKEKINNDFDVIYCSPLSRAHKTAEILASDSGKEVIVIPEIREINFGEWEGLTIKEIEQKYSEIFKVWRTDKIEAPIVGGDASIKNACGRALKCINAIVSKNQGKKIVVVAHGGIIKAAMIALFNWDMNMYHKILLGNTCVNKIIFKDDNTPILMCLNDTSHLNCESKSV